MKLEKLTRITGIIILSFFFSLSLGCDTITGMLGMGGGETEEVAKKSSPANAQPGGSKGDSSPADKKANQKKAEKKKAKKKQQQEKQKTKKWEYIPENKNDPFEVPPPPQMPAGSTVGQQYDLEQLLLIGIIKGSGYDAAYIRLPNGEGKVVRVNDPLGKMGGVVTEIGKDHIIVEETYIKPREDTTFVIKKRMPMVEVEE